MQGMDLDQFVAEIDVQKDQVKIDHWIREFNPFIISTLSKIKNSYIEIENDDAYSIALLAVVEAMDRYDINKGPFLPFCRLVIDSRVKNHFKSEARHFHSSIDEEVIVKKLDATSAKMPPDSVLNDEIRSFEAVLATFRIKLEDLVSGAPKHSDTKTLIAIAAKKVHSDSELMTFLYQKKRLPITQIATRYFISPKTLKTYKSYFIAILLILDHRYRNIAAWIKL